RGRFRLVCCSGDGDSGRWQGSCEDWPLHCGPRGHLCAHRTALWTGGEENDQHRSRSCGPRLPWGGRRGPLQPWHRGFPRCSWGPRRAADS
ncbi:DUT1, partial [Symbiodinium pilosum]